MTAQPTGTRLVIVESPTKARTIRRFLPTEYQVEASMGHVRDLPSGAAEIPEKFKSFDWATLGVNVEANFEPLYVVSSSKKEIVKKLKDAMKTADELFIATDEDREGESIGWHLVELLNPKIPVKRMVFHEITKSAIQNALTETRELNTDLVEAQEARRILDRLVGYTISPLLWRKIGPKLSAGRVQSVAVRLLVMREQERLRFMSAGYWDLQAKLNAGTAAFTATLTNVDELRVAAGRDFDPETGLLKDGTVHGTDVVHLQQADANALETAAAAGQWAISNIEEREQARQPAAPFTTSTMQQEASRKLGLAARDTMRIAQSLYEQGYITYMRTDSTSLSSEALTASRETIVARYGNDYLPEKPRIYGARGKNVQEAHEAIRPAGTEMKTAAEHHLRGYEAELYDLIWKRTVASQMTNARLKFVTARIQSKLANPVTVNGVTEPARELLFRATGRTVVFPGFFRAYVEGTDDPEQRLDDTDQPLPPLSVGDALQQEAVTSVGHETKPPARYTEASLVKLLETEGIGRPSTYASIIDTIQRRGYVMKQGQQLIPSFTGFATNNLLEQQFTKLVDTEFTAQMERVLDDIAAGEKSASKYLQEFYLGSGGIKDLVELGMEQVDGREISTIQPKSWEPFLVRVGRYGPYVEGPLESGELKTASLPNDLAPGDLTREQLETYLVEGNMGDIEAATTEDGEVVLLKRGPFGPYLQLGTGEDEKKKPKRVSLPPGVSPHDMTEQLALDLIALPRTIGTHPESGKNVDVSIGRYGPYVRHQQTYASIPKDEFLLDVKLERALELLAKKNQRGGAALRIVGEDPESGESIELRDGRYGPYVKRGKVNASIPRGSDPEALTLAEALELLAAREERMAKRKPAKKKAAAKKTTRKTKKKAAKKPARPKATPDDLIPLLPRLPEDEQTAVQHIEGWNTSVKNAAEVGTMLGVSEEDALALHKRGLFKLRMAFGRERSKS